jgi:2-iminobutanoate/2-iminopropanoate deaminase
MASKGGGGVSHKIIKTDQAPAAIGPYSQGVIGCGLLFTAMQIALDPASGEMTGTTAVEQVSRCLNNIKAIAEAAGGALDHAVKVTVYLTDMNQFAAVNEAYAGFFSADPPARAVVEVSRLPKEALVAVEAVIAVTR